VLATDASGIGAGPRLTATQSDQAESAGDESTDQPPAGRGGRHPTREPVEGMRFHGRLLVDPRGVLSCVAKKTDRSSPGHLFAATSDGNPV
jgi:hypothetical protein